jgi:cation diffusion facilitator CzcD-associated flavoprotein CzcO
MRVAVIGGGGSGCVVLRELVSQGFDAMLFEASDALGGVWWNYRYDSLTTNSSRKVTELACAPLEGDDLFACGDELRDYYSSLAPPGRYQLLCPVKLVQQEGSGFLVVFATGEKRSFDAVVCCTGTFQKPVTHVEWLPSYDGPWMHSSDYRFPELFTGRVRNAFYFCLSLTLLDFLTEGCVDWYREFGA